MIFRLNTNRKNPYFIRMQTVIVETTRLYDKSSYSLGGSKRDGDRGRRVARRDTVSRRYHKYFLVFGVHGETFGTYKNKGK